MKAKILIGIILLMAACAGFYTSLVIHAKKPIDIETDQSRTFHYPIKFLNQLQNDPHADEKIYFEYCAACHAPEPIIPVRAPHLGNKKEWEPYCKLGINQLLTLANQGLGAMPARGGCFECTDKLIKKTILFILQKSKLHCRP